MTWAGMSSRFVFDTEPMALPEGAWAKTGRHILQYDGRDVIGITQGEYRSYLYPVYTPNGFSVTSESPADHPHHNSIWLGSDHVRGLMPTSDDGFEEYTYNFYVNETFQGRAPGKILSTALSGEALGLDGFRVSQTLEWRGPPEWAAPQSRTVLRERRTIDVVPGREYYVIDVRCELQPVELDIELGPTRHAFFNVRVAESLRASAGGQMLDSMGRTGSREISGVHADWVSISGPAGAGHKVGVAVMSRPQPDRPSWFVSDWGVVTVGHFRHKKKRIGRGETARFEFRVVVHDGAAVAADLVRQYDNYVDSCSL